MFESEETIRTQIDTPLTEHGLKREADFPPELLNLDLIVVQQLGHQHARVCGGSHVGQDAGQDFDLVGVLLEQRLRHAHRCRVSGGYAEVCVVSVS